MDIKDVVKQKYSEAALRVLEGGSSCCCGPKAPIGNRPDGAHLTRDLRGERDFRDSSRMRLWPRLGCGNPTALAQLKPGETVLDLGSGGGIDVFLSAKRVAPIGKVFGLDMTDEMLALARENQKKAGVENVEFLKGEIENIPLPDNSVDVVISNCVINLSVDKGRVLREAFRVLKPGGRFAVSDVVLCGEIPAPLRNNPELWAGCVAGAMQESKYKSELAAAGLRGCRYRADEGLPGRGRSRIPVCRRSGSSRPRRSGGRKDHERLCARHQTSPPAPRFKESRELYPQIQILGTGCARCRDLTANVEKAVQGLGIEARVEKVTEITDIMKFQILMTPGLVINGQVKAAGRIPPVEEIMQMLATAGGN